MFRLVLALLGLSFSAPAAAAQGTGRPEFQGYWILADHEDSDYDHYLKIKADSGFSCVRDGKSSFRFKIRGDSITTPMNGMDAITATSPGTLRISGEEKGERYKTDFRSMPASGYPKACDEEERALYGGPVALKPVRKRGPMPAPEGDGGRFDAAGRSSDASPGFRRVFPLH